MRNIGYLVILALAVGACGDKKSSKRRPGDDDLPRLPPEAADTCDPTLGSILTGDVLSATTVGANNDAVAPCSGLSTGPDVFFRLVLDAPAGLEAVVTGYDSVVYLLRGPCGAGDAVAGACSDIAGDTEILQVAELSAGEYFLAVDSLETAGGGGPGDFTLTVTIEPAGVCVDDDLDRNGLGDDAATALVLGAAAVDTSGAGLRICGDDIDVLTFGHLGGQLDVAVTGATGQLFVAMPVREEGDIVIDGDVVVEKGVAVGAPPYSGDAAAGLYLLEVSAAAGTAGVDYTVTIGHACEPDAYDHPLAELDDSAPERARFTLSDVATAPADRRLCASDVDGYLIAVAATGNVTLTLTGGALLLPTLEALDPMTGVLSPITIATTANGADLEIDAGVLAPGPYFLTLSAPAGTTVSYAVTATVPLATTCDLAIPVAGASGQIDGSTLGQANRLDTARAPLGPSSCTGDSTAGPETLYAIDVPENSILTLTLDADFDGALYAFDCLTGLPCLGGADDDVAADANTESLVVAGAGTTLFVGVDSYDAMIRGAYTLAWEIATPGIPVCGNGVIEDGEQCDDGGSPPASDDGCSYGCQLELGWACPTAGLACTALAGLVGDDACPAGNVQLPLPAASGVTGLLVNPTLAGLTDTVTGTCGGLLGPEAIYSFTAAQAATYVLSANGSDTILYLRGDSCAGSEIVCNDDSSAVGAGGSQVTVTTEAGRTYFVILDFFSASPGLSQLLVARPNP